MFRGMSPDPVIILHAATPQAALRSYRCANSLELSGAVAQEMMRAVEPMTIIRWLEQEDFHQFLTHCFTPTGLQPPEAMTPGPCHYLDATEGARLMTVLTVEAGQ